MEQYKRVWSEFRRSKTFIPGVVFGIVVGFFIGFVVHGLLPSSSDLRNSDSEVPVAEELTEAIDENLTDPTGPDDVVGYIDNERERWADSVDIDRGSSGRRRPVIPDNPTRGSSGLIIPVDGVRKSDLYDSFDDGRSGGRVHNALDIPAAEGTPVLAATGGEVLRLFTSDLGGLTLYQRGDDGLIYYYAHLQDYAHNISEGSRVEPGDVVAYVGNSGNAGPDNYHLHFAIWIPEDSSSFWDGIAINPYPLLTGSRDRRTW